MISGAAFASGSPDDDCLHTSADGRDADGVAPSGGATAAALEAMAGSARAASVVLDTTSSGSVAIVSSGWVVAVLGETPGSDTVGSIAACGATRLEPFDSVVARGSGAVDTVALATTTVVDSISGDRWADEGVATTRLTPSDSVTGAACTTPSAMAKFAASCTASSAAAVVGCIAAPAVVCTVANFTVPTDG